MKNKNLLLFIIVIVVVVTGIIFISHRFSKLLGLKEKVYVVSFAHECCVRAQQNLEKSALMFGCDKVYSLNLDTLDAPENVKKYIRTHKRGAGYWIWKAYALKQILTISNPGDIVIYVDASTYFNKSIETICTFINKYSILCFIHNVHQTQSMWTKMNAFKYIYPENDSLCETEGKKVQFMAALCGVKNNQIGNSFVNMFLDVLNPDNSALYDDSPSTLKNCDDFKESRHDQQMLSLILYKYYSDIPFPVYSKDTYGFVFHEDINGNDRHV